MVKANPRPSFFKAMMGDFSSSMRIPQSFSKHLRGRLGESCVLTTRGGKRWKVAVGRGSSDEFSLLSGWNRFVNDQSISLGDFLVFFYDGGLKFDVDVYGKSGCDMGNDLDCVKKNNNMGSGMRSSDICVGRTSKTCIPMKGNRTGNRKDGTFLRACAFKPSNPYFVIAYRREFAFRTTIPRLLVEEYGLKEKKFITLQGPSGSTWQGKLSTALDGRVYLYRWKPFLKVNHIKEGDSCVFEFLHNGDLLNVHIFRAGVKEEFTESVHTPRDLVHSNEQTLRWTDQEKPLAVANFMEANDTGDSVHSNEQSLKLTDHEKAILAANFTATVGDLVYSNEQNLKSINRYKAFTAAKSFKTEHPNFVFSWRKTRLYYVNIPQNLMVNLDLEIDQSVVLRDKFGRLWPVKIQSWTEGRSMILGLGWSKFAKGNCLVEGDACLFEFVEAAEIKVHIFRVDEAEGATQGT